MKSNGRIQINGLLLVCVLAALVQAGNPSHSIKLVVAGGGKLPSSVYEEFHRLAGQTPVLAVVPTATSRAVDETAIEKTWKERGFERVSVLHTTDRELASTDNFLSALDEATAVWFSGGSQQRLADAYCGTRFEKALEDVLNRGGVVGGSSAGAAIQSKTMIASGNPVPRISQGFDLVPCAIVDQHFLRRNRIQRLANAIELHPSLTGIGVDEGTAVVIQDGTCRVVGDSYVLKLQVVESRLSIEAFNQGEEFALPASDEDRK